MNTPNPFTPPKADLSQTSPPGSPIKAVLLGFAADFGGSIAIGIPLTIAYGIYLGASGVPVNQIESLLTEAEPGSVFAMISFGIGFLFSLLGGYVCARIAKHHEYRLATIVAVLSTLAGIPFFPEHFSLGTDLVLTLLSCASVLFGAHLGHSKNHAPGRVDTSA